MKFNDFIDIKNSADDLLEHPGDNDNKFTRSIYFSTPWELIPGNHPAERQKRWKRQRQMQSILIIGIMSIIMATVILIFAIPFAIR